MKAFFVMCGRVWCACRPFASSVLDASDNSRSSSISSRLPARQVREKNKLGAKTRSFSGGHRGCLGSHKGLGQPKDCLGSDRCCLGHCKGCLGMHKGCLGRHRNLGKPQRLLAEPQGVAGEAMGATLEAAGAAWSPQALLTEPCPLHWELLWETQTRLLRQPQGNALGATIPRSPHGLIAQ